jgi:putative hydrolase of the HAD superfamily
VQLRRSALARNAAAAKTFRPAMLRFGQPHLTPAIAATGARRVIAFDGDDTLWIDDTEEKRWERDFQHLAVERLPHPAMAEAFRRHLRQGGYTLESVQWALTASAQDVCGGDVPLEWRAQVEAIPDLAASLKLRLPHGLDRALDRLTQSGYALWIVTKGDLIRQAIKLSCFPLIGAFEVVEIVERKNTAAYTRVLAAQGRAPSSLTMVGDAFWADVAPVVRLGGRGIHVPARRWVAPFHALLPTRRIRVCRTVAEVPDVIAVDG